LLAVQFFTYGISGGGNDPDLAAWYEQAYAYYNAVESGVEPRPGDAEWNQFLNQMQWAYQQLKGSGGSWANPYGGTSGPQGNMVYNDKKVRIGFTGEGVHDIWSNDFTLDVALSSAKVTVEKTLDTRFSPPEDVIKITVKDPATGKERVYFVHGFDSMESVKINTPNAKNVTDPTRLVKVGKFTYRKPADLKKPGTVKPTPSQKLSH
jgi:hypothetical protein